MPEPNLPYNHTAIIEEEVSKVLELCSIERPPVDAFQVAERLDYEIGVDEALDNNRGYKRKRWGRDEIVVNSPSRSERKHFLIAHEISEHVLENLIIREDLETACNAMASSLLMPSQWFEPDAKGCNFDLLELKKIYSTASHEVISYRMLQFSECIITIFDKGKVTVRKASMNTSCRHLHPLETKCFHKVTNSAEPCADSGDNIHVQGWPVFRNNWKRVILRTEMDMI